MSWQQVSLGEVLTLHYGKALPKGDRNPSGDIPLYGANGIKEYSDRSLSTGPSLIIGRKGSAGEITRVEGPFWPLDVTYFTEHDDTRVDFDFLEYALRMMDLPSFAKGVKPGINRNEVYGMPISLPPLDEQKRIVAVLDQAFAALERARANAEANLADAEELHPSIVTSLIETRGKEWPLAKLGDVYDVRDGTHDSPKYLATGRPLVTSKNLGRDGLNFHKVKFISEEDFVAISRRSAVNLGDVLFAMIGTIGNPIVVDVEPNFAIKNVALFKMKDGRSGGVLRHLLGSRSVQEKMAADAKGTTQRFVGLGYLRNFETRIPRGQDEPEILAELNRSEFLASQLRNLCLQEMKDIDDLRQSILQKAFAGELT